MSFEKTLEQAKRFAPELVTNVLGLLRSIVARDTFGMAVFSVGIVKAVGMSMEDKGRSFFRHVIREIAEDTSDALADKLGQSVSIHRDPPKVT